MKEVSKCLIFDSKNNVLLLFRSKTHPRWPLEGDFPGGSAEEDEDIYTATAREIAEEVGIKIEPNDIKLVYEEIVNTSDKNKRYSVTEAKIEDFPEIKLSWEHSNYKIVKLNELINDNANHSKDDYFQTVLKYLKEKKS